MGWDLERRRMLLRSALESLGTLARVLSRGPVDKGIEGLRMRSTISAPTVWDRTWGLCRRRTPIGNSLDRSRGVRSEMEDGLERKRLKRTSTRGLSMSPCGMSLTDEEDDGSTKRRREISGRRVAGEEDSLRKEARKSR